MTKRDRDRLMDLARLCAVAIADGRISLVVRRGHMRAVVSAYKELSVKPLKARPDADR